MAESNHARVTPANDEIDLLDLISTLWQRKFLIVLIAALGFAGAYGASLLMKEEWRSTAMVVGPRVANTEALLDYKRAIKRITNASEDIDVSAILKGVFSLFLYTAADSDEKNNYLSKTELFERLTKESNNSPGVILDALSENLVVDLPDDKEKSLLAAHSISFTADTPEVAQAILTGYLMNINDRAQSLYFHEASNSFNASIERRKQQIADIERNLATSRQVSIENYESALKTAQKAGIKSAPGGLSGRTDVGNNLVLEINPNPQQLYLQGEEILQALLDVAKNEPIIYPSNYYEMKYELQALEKVTDVQPQFLSFNYQMRPTLPTQRISPKRAQLAVLGGVLGGVLACLYVLIAGAFANRRRAAATGNA